MTQTKRVALVNDGERMVPELHRNNLFYAEHMARYEATAELIKDKVVLDIAAGSGYGTKMISEHAKMVYGVDVSQNAIDYANDNYSAKNIQYILGDGQNIPLDDNSVDVVVTFETIEHIDDYVKFMDEVHRVLKKDGLAIVSTPNDLEYAEGNHFHLHEFVYDELLKLLKKDFKFIDSYFQSTWKAVLTGSLDAHTKPVSQSLDVTNYGPLKDADSSLYFYLVCSNKPISKKLKSSVGLGVHLSEASEQKKEMKLYERIDQIEKEKSSYLEEIVELKRILEDEEELANKLRLSRYMKHYVSKKMLEIKKKK